ncbi:MAG: hypothetical protein WC683_07015 [bacterium]
MTSKQVFAALWDLTRHKSSEAAWCQAFERALDAGAVPFQRGNAQGVFVPCDPKGFQLYFGRPVIVW